jgi:hypothetical protein
LPRPVRPLVRVAVWGAKSRLYGPLSTRRAHWRTVAAPAPCRYPAEATGSDARR